MAQGFRGCASYSDCYCDCGKCHEEKSPMKHCLLHENDCHFECTKT